MRALLADPRLLILDEVSLGLAPVVVDQLYGPLERVRATGVLILLVEQNTDSCNGDLVNAWMR